LHIGLGIVCGVGTGDESSGPRYSATPAILFKHWASIDAKIVLIDGIKLSQLLIDFDVGG
jgi:hypothetical protein